MVAKEAGKLRDEFIWLAEGVHEISSTLLPDGITTRAIVDGDDHQPQIDEGLLILCSLKGLADAKKLIQEAQPLRNPVPLWVVAEETVIQWPLGCDGVFVLPDDGWRLKGQLESALQQAGQRQAQIRRVLDLEFKIAKVNRDNHLLERKNEDLSQFTNTVAHDLNHPLNTMISYLDLLGNSLVPGGTVDEDVPSLIDRVNRSSRRLGNMIKDLLVSAKHSHSEEPIEQVDLDEVMSDVMNDLEDLASVKEAKISVGNLPRVMGARSQLYQVFLNLVSNAIKFTRKGVPPLVKVYTKSVTENNEDRQVEIVQVIVQDNGIGISREDFDQLFRPFSRLGTSNHIEGTGLGLVTVKKIIALHAGSIKVESDLNVGTRFYITLPINLDDNAVPFFRKELRFDCPSDKVVISRVYRPDRRNYMLKLINESEKGVCCQCVGKHDLSVDSIVELEESKRYTVRWIKEERENLAMLGLKLID